MASLILISVLAILCLVMMVLVIHWILGQAKDQTSTATAMSEALTAFQSSQASQLNGVLDRHSSDLQRVLSAQSQYINQFLNGTPIDPTQPHPVPQPEPPDLSQSDPANWSLAEQMEHLPRQMQDEINREQAEQEWLDRLSAPSHPIRTYPGTPLIDPSLSSTGERVQANGSWSMSDDLEV